MAKKTKQAKSAIPYVQRLAEDDYIQGQLRNAADRLREASARARRKRGRAVEDKKLYANLSEAATSIRKAAGRLQRKPKPKRRGRKLAAAAVMAGGAALVWRRKASGQADYPVEGAGQSYTPAASSAGEAAGQETPSPQPPSEPASN
jgi:ferric-dicitrate binding protein FerR (iron transport regulator)